MKLVVVKDFFELMEESWNLNFSEWPNRNCILPPIFQREVKENLNLLKTTTETFVATNETARNLEIQQLENLKQDFFNQIQDIAKGPLRMFVIYRLEINEEMNSHLSSQMKSEILIPKGIKLEFLLFTNTCQVIIIKFAQNDFNSAANELEKASRFLLDILPERKEFMPIHLMLFCSGKREGTNNNLQRETILQTHISFEIS